MIEASLCHIIGKNGLLLKKASRGISRGKWNAPGGKLEPDEDALTGAKREVYEETGLRVSRLVNHGTVRYFMNGTKALHTRAQIYSTRTFVGAPRSTDEGRVKWFHVDQIPFEKMWDDDKYWFGLMLGGSRFNADFFYSRDNERVIDFRLDLRG